MCSISKVWLQDSGVEPWLLDTQYRMHPAIAELPNLLFYDGRIRTGIKAHQRPTPAGISFMLHGVSTF